MTEVALLTDIHMRDNYVGEISQELEHVLDHLNRHYNLKHAFVLGDLIEDCGSVTADRENVRRVRAIIEDWSVPTTYLIGNHDVEYLNRTQLSDLLGQESFFGVKRIDETPIVYLDSTYQEVGGATGRLGHEQLSWLSDTLPTLSDAIILVHHPFGNFDLTENEWFSEYPERAYLWDRKDALKVFDETGSVRATISGHIHQTDSDEFWNIQHISINAFSKELPDVPLTGTYAVLDIDTPSEIEIATRSETAVTYTLGY